MEGVFPGPPPSPSGMPAPQVAIEDNRVILEAGTVLGVEPSERQAEESNPKRRWFKNEDYPGGFALMPDEYELLEN